MSVAIGRVYGSALGGGCQDRPELVDEVLPLRHRDHRFEWTRAEFEEWAQGLAERFEYDVRFLPVGPDDVEVGAPTQIGVFEGGVHV